MDSASSGYTNDQIFYRGQADSSWGLTPSIARSQHILDREDELFYEMLSLKPNDFNNDSSTYEQLITMQHYGLPTRLMDLTRNPLISLYFSCIPSDKSLAKDGALFLIKEDKKDILNFASEKIDPLSKLVETPAHKLADFLKENPTVIGTFIVKGVAKNQRINNQSGDFIFLGQEIMESAVLPK